MKVKAHAIIDAFPEDKMAKVLTILENVKDLINDDPAEEWDIQLIKEAMEEENGEGVSLDEVVEELRHDTGKSTG